MTPATRLEVILESTDPVVLVLRGELDPTTAPELEEALDGALDQADADGSPELVIDMADLTFIDSSGLRTLLAAHRRLSPVPLRVRAPSPFARQLLTVTGLEDRFEIEPGSAS